MELPYILAVFLVIALAIIGRGYILSEWLKWARKGREKQIASVGTAKKPTSILTDGQGRIKASILEKIPDTVRIKVEKAPFDKQVLFIEDYFLRYRDIVSAYCFWLLFGIHYSYLEENKKQWLYWFTLGGLLIWAVVDLFRIPGMVAEYNRNLAVSILEN
ncbi:hypothetical protein ES703_65851 [subsurface metagenome]